MKKLKKLDLTKILLPYAKKRLWVALSSKGDKVVTSGKDPIEALEKAKKKRARLPILIQAIPDYSGFVPKSQK